MSTGMIYIATLNDKSYIGLTTRSLEKRKKEHLRLPYDCLFSRAIKKHGSENIEWRILEDDIPEARLPDREELWIAFYDTYYNGYNMSEGGENSPMSNPEVVNKVSITHKERVAKGEHHMFDPERAAQHSEFMKGPGNPSRDPKVGEKISIALKKLGAEGKNPSQDLAITGPKGRKHSKVMKEKAAKGEHPMQDPMIAKKVGDKIKGIPKSIEHRNKIAEAAIKRFRSVAEGQLNLFEENQDV